MITGLTIEEEPKDPIFEERQKLRLKIFLLGFTLKYYKSTSIDKSIFPTVRSFYKKIVLFGVIFH